ncbi:MAG: hypothetical protein QOD95_3563 [Gammaproteobacteria bacterium]|nr:hypothetical protein [Gammaproteobacteria bacterium]
MQHLVFGSICFGVGAAEFWLRAAIFACRV